MMTTHLKYALRAVILLGVALLAPLTALAAGEPEPHGVYPKIPSVVFEPDWFPNGQFAGFFWAKNEGLYDNAGLHVGFRKFAFGNDGIESVAKGYSHFGTAEAYILMQEIAGGAPLVVLGAVLQKSPAGYIHLASVEIESAADLAGKRIGVHAFAEGLLPFFLEEAGLEPDAATAVPVHHQIEVLLDGSLDLHQGYAIDEMIRLHAMTGDPVEITSFEELGLPMYSMLLYTSRAYLEEHPEQVTAFLDASAAGWKAALAEPTKAARLISDFFPDDRVDDALLAPQIEALREFVIPENRPIFSIQAEKWAAMQEALKASGQIDRIVPLEEAVHPSAIAK
jgi:NitT/TauT family transport system substrate-binding protein